MRELRVIGLDTNGGSVICQDPDSGEKFQVPADDRLRAAARGDISRLGQIEIEMESTLRPREIQARIRAGASVAQVASAAGVTPEKVSRFAHPVLLERSRAAELASSSHPIRIDGPALSTLAEVVASALGARGHNPEDTDWDAWKSEDGRWIVQVSWRVGRSENHAHWRYQPGSGGGTTEPLDETADEITDPDLSRPLRGLTSVVSLASAGEQYTVGADDLIGRQRARVVAADTPDLLQPTLVDHHVEPVEDIDDIDDLDLDDVPPAEIDREPAEIARETTAEPQPPAAGDTEPATPVADPLDMRSSAPTSDEAPTPRRRKAARKPAVPAWEDVLLGVRSNGHQ
ncbi:MAG: septation protein SepH [Corynebacteriales bacterium]|nr:septation protein SepH [Mycobacteriales bacterium]